MKPRPFWFALGVTAQIAVLTVMILGALLGAVLMTRLAPFRYMEF